MLLFFFTDTAPPAIYTLSLHDALPISTQHAPYSTHERFAGPGSCSSKTCLAIKARPEQGLTQYRRLSGGRFPRSEEHTSELQSHVNLVCRLLLEKKKIIS